MSGRDCGRACPFAPWHFRTLQKEFAGGNGTEVIGPGNGRCCCVVSCGWLYVAGVRQSSYSGEMSPLRARVQNGRIVLDEPTTLRDGTVINLVADDEGDDLTAEERRALHEALSASSQSVEAGQLRPASEILDELRRQR